MDAQAYSVSSPFEGANKYIYIFFYLRLYSSFQELVYSAKFILHWCNSELNTNVQE